LNEVSNAIDDLVAVVSSFIVAALLILLCIAVPAFWSLAQMPCIHLEEKFTPKPSEKLNVVGWYSASVLTKEQREIIEKLGFADALF